MIVHRRRDRSQAGHTLIELLVVTTLMGLLTMLVAQVWKPLSKSTRDLRERASVSTELRLATEFLRRDLGGAGKVGAEDLKPDVLQIEREYEVANVLQPLAPGQADPGVQYQLKQDRLVRLDQLTGQEFVVGQGLTEFLVEANADGDTQIVLSAGRAPHQRKLTLVWVR
jgi:prepilin-type N-terminal cleavage/methylation domain-containing protein